MPGEKLGIGWTLDVVIGDVVEVVCAWTMGFGILGGAGGWTLDVVIGVVVEVVCAWTMGFGILGGAGGARVPKLFLASAHRTG